MRKRLLVNNIEITEIWNSITESMNAVEYFDFDTYAPRHKYVVNRVRHKIKALQQDEASLQEMILKLNLSEYNLVLNSIKDALRGVEAWEIPFRIGASKDELESLLVKVREA